MSVLHIANVLVHVLAGTTGLVIGAVLLVRRKGTSEHRRWGRRFGTATLVVGISAAIGSVFFRFLPLFAVLNVLVLYQLVSGWRVVYTKDEGPGVIDGLWTLVGALATATLLPVLLTHPNAAAPAVLYPTLGALATLLAYDAARWAFPRRWHARLWRYEHVYKMTASFFGMASAAAGNLIRFGQPWSQIAPSVLGVFVIAWFFVRLSRPRPEPATAAEPEAPEATPVRQRREAAAAA